VKLFGESCVSIYKHSKLTACLKRCCLFCEYSDPLYAVTLSRITYRACRCVLFPRMRRPGCAYAPKSLLRLRVARAARVACLLITHAHKQTGTNRTCPTGHTQQRACARCKTGAHALPAIVAHAILADCSLPLWQPQRSTIPIRAWARAAGRAEGERTPACLPIWQPTRVHFARARCSIPPKGVCLYWAEWDSDAPYVYIYHSAQKFKLRKSLTANVKGVLRIAIWNIGHKNL